MKAKTDHSIYQKIARQSELPMPKTTSALNALCATVNFAINNNLISLEYDETNPMRLMINGEFILLGRKALFNIREISHGELRISMAVPALNRIPRSPAPTLDGKLTRDYDFFTFGWFERKTGKFIQGCVTCRTRRMPWNKALEETIIEPEGYSISSRFFS